ncbi:MAG: RdgB/HAM1 family non-canonical purine NTP pyrophosphatase [Alphaproteobacteria bacterium]|nr:RdgB/HAM1 family non-canonical purine NTP pyrophosphatase [Alphaproteobacteria bacterium]
MKLQSGKTVVVASHNPGKVREIADLLGPFALTIKSAAQLGLAEPEETGDSFAANAELKARAAADASMCAALADDSGLVVDALGGAPGIYSARWAGPNRDFTAAMARIERELAQKSVTAARAKFVCALALAEPRGDCAIFEGEVHGHLRFPPSGDKGFGYDPIFVADGMKQSFGEIDPALKHRLSHRAQAFAKLVAALKMP